MASAYQYIEPPDTKGPHMTSQQLFTLRQAADIACVDPKTIRRRISDGDLRATRLGPRLIRIAEADLDAFLAGRQMA